LPPGPADESAAPVAPPPEQAPSTSTPESASPTSIDFFMCLLSVRGA
jgi:hypothetical protein